MLSTSLILNLAVSVLVNCTAKSAITSTPTTKKYSSTTTNVPNLTNSNESTSSPMKTSSTMTRSADTKTAEISSTATAGKYQMQN